MLVGEMSINLADQDAAIFVADPAGDGHVVDSRHDAVRNEVMPAIVKAEALHPRGRAGQLEGFREGLGRCVFVAPLWAWEEPLRVGGAARVHVAQVGFQSGVEIHMARLAVFGAAFRADGQQTLLEIDVGPAKLEGFVAPAARAGHEPEVVGQLLSVLARGDCGEEEAFQFGGGDERALLGGRFLRGNALGRQGFDVTVPPRGFQQQADGNEIEVGCTWGAAALPDLRNEAGDVRGTQLVEPEMSQLGLPAGEIALVLLKRAGADAGDLALVEEDLGVCGKRGALPDGAEAIFLPLHEQSAKLILGFGDCCRFDGDIGGAFLPIGIFDDNPGVELSIAPPESANRVLAVVENFGVGLTAVSPVAFGFGAVHRATVQQCQFLEIKNHVTTL